MRMGIALREIERSDLCREGATGRAEISDCQGVETATEVGKAVLTYHRQGLARKRMDWMVLGFYCLFPW